MLINFNFENIRKFSFSDNNKMIEKMNVTRQSFTPYKNPDIHPSLIQENHNENHNENQKIRDISVKAKENAC